MRNVKGSQEKQTGTDTRYLLKLDDDPVDVETKRDNNTSAMKMTHPTL